MLGDTRGFTLIELIAVLVILGILAAVAIPKYYDLTEEARNKAANGALAEARGRVNQFIAQQLLSTGAYPPTSAYNATNLGNDAGDFDITWTMNAGTPPVLQIDVAGKANTPAAGASTTGYLTLP